MAETQALCEELQAKYSCLLAKPLNAPHFWSGDRGNQEKLIAHCNALRAFISECDAIPESMDAIKMACSAKNNILKTGKYCANQGNCLLQARARPSESASWFYTAIHILELIPGWRDAEANILQCRAMLGAGCEKAAEADAQPDAPPETSAKAAITGRKFLALAAAFTAFACLACLVALLCRS